ncbi:MAG: peptidyl-alpha-hydroxyglycine alpha-amidating lyase family protein [Candidatus Hydrogenedentota bacterium]
MQMHSVHSRRSCFLFVWLVALWLTTPLLVAQTAEPPEQPEYPRVNPAPHYTVDPDWPQKPADIEWGAVPSVAIDNEGNVWMYTRSAPSVQVYSPEGEFLFSWGDTPGAHFIEIDREGHIWTTDVHEHVVQKHTRDGTVLLTLGTRGEPGTDGGHLFKPTDVAVASNGDIFVSDGYGNARVVHYTPEGEYVKAWGDMGTEPGAFSISHAIEVDSKDRLYLADRNNARVQVFNTDGELLAVWDDILVPWGIHINEDDEVWVCGSSPMTWTDHPDYPTAPLGCPPKDQVVIRFDTGGCVQQMWTFPKGEDGAEEPGELNWLHGIAVDDAGNLFLGDIIGKRLQKFVHHPAG